MWYWKLAVWCIAGTDVIWVIAMQTWVISQISTNLPTTQMDLHLYQLWIQELQTWWTFHSRLIVISFAGDVFIEVVWTQKKNNEHRNISMVLDGYHFVTILSFPSLSYAPLNADDNLYSIRIGWCDALTSLLMGLKSTLESDA